LPGTVRSFDSADFLVMKVSRKNIRQSTLATALNRVNLQLERIPS